MTNTTNYNLNIVEGTDIVNPLTQFNPNFNIIDGVMKNNADAAVSPATCIKSGTVHTITRSNTGAEMFVFTATGDWNSGDTMTVDGTPVTPVLPDGTALLDGSYLINAEVLASIKGTKVTVYSNNYNIGAAIIDNLTSSATDKALSAHQGKVLNEKFKIAQKNFGSFNVSGNTYYDIDIDVTEADYIPVGVIQWAVFGTGALVTIYVNIQNSTTARIRVRNTDSAPTTSTGGNITVLYEKA